MSPIAYYDSASCIEIDIDGGHALFIADSDKKSLDAFEAICNQIPPLV